MIKQSDSLQSTTKISAFARKGLHVLDKARGNIDVDSSMIDKLLLDPGKVQMKYMNKYLNQYTEKLARANPDEPSNIQIDKTDLY